MDIHEIIHAWENSALPNSLDALAAIQNKVDDYRAKAEDGYRKTASRMVESMYAHEIRIYSVISSDIDALTDSLIGKEGIVDDVEPAKQADMSDWVQEGGAEK